MAASMTIIFTLVYFLFCCCLLYPPTEVIASGITVESIFSSFLGSEDILFVNYHVKRTALTLVLHSFIPIGYCLGSEWFFDTHGLISSTLTAEAEFYVAVFILSAFVFPILTSSLVFYWSRNDWKNHPVCINLCKYGRPRWQAVAAHINTEYRRIDKFSSGHGNISRVVVTDSWLVKISPYFINIIQQSDAELNLLTCEQHELSHVDSTGVQFLTISVMSVSNRVTSFNIRLNSMEYGDLREKLQLPVNNARNIVIHQTLNERFVEAFSEQVRNNPTYSLPENSAPLEPCIGCMQTTSNVKLERVCDDNGNRETNCINCYCRPMWCLECMGKWFASRQDAAHPETWLSKSSPCPTCRSKFCMLDVHLIDT